MSDSWEGARIRVVEQAAAVLYAFSASQPEMGVRELARKLELSVSTAQRVLTSLAHVQLLSFDERTQKYSLGPGVLQLAAAFPQQNDLVTVARLPMEQLWRATRESICLHVCVADRRVTLYQIESPHELRFKAEIGRPYPLHAGAAGRALLAHLPEREIDRILSAIELERLTDNTITDPVELREELSTCRRLGYSVSRGERVAGGAGIAAPILPHGQLVGSVSIYGPELRLTDERIQELIPLLLETTRQIAAHWGGPNPTPAT